MIFLLKFFFFYRKPYVYNYSFYIKWDLRNNEGMLIPVRVFSYCVTEVSIVCIILFGLD